MILLSLDLATELGFCVGPIDGEPEFGAHKLPRTGADIGRFLSAYEQWLVPACQRWKPGYVSFEAPVFFDAGKTNLATVRKLYSLAGFTEYLCGQMRVRVAELNNQEAKRWFTGKGGRKGDRIIRECQLRGFETTNDNAADALCGWCWTISKEWPEHAVGPKGPKQLALV
jgi:hypothetical protein